MRTRRPPSRLRAIVTENLRSQRGSLALAALALLGVIVMDLIAPWPLKIILDHVLLDRPLPPALGFLQGLLARWRSDPSLDQQRFFFLMCPSCSDGHCLEKKVTVHDIAIQGDEIHCLAAPMMAPPSTAMNIGAAT